LPLKNNNGICNLTSNYFCEVSVKGEDTFTDTLSTVSKQMKLQKKSDSCLKSVIMIEFIFSIFSFGFLRRNFGKFFKVPVISYTNIGVIDKQRTNFGHCEVEDIFITGAIKYVPYFQIAVSTFYDTCTLSSNLHGTDNDKSLIESYLDEIINEITEACN
jgi:NRPS condensation-like uncharacterized protein